MDKESKIYIAGHEGMVGSILFKEMKRRGYRNLITIPFKQLDLRNQRDTYNVVKEEKPEYIFLIAGKVGGIQANIKFPAEFLYDNLMISANVIESARINKVKKLIFLGSSCIYPRLSPQPMKEEYLLTGALEPTNEGYAIGKIAGLKLCEFYLKQYGCNFIAAMPPNLYGPGDNFSLANSHVISALIKKIHKAKIEKTKYVEMWGSGSARREFLFNEDVADGLIFLMKNYEDGNFINIGSNNDVSIKELSEIIKEIIGYDGEFKWDKTKPDGMPQKLLDSSRIYNMGWKTKNNLKDGLSKTYKWYLNNY